MNSTQRLPRFALVLLLLIIHSTSAILHGDTIEWNRVGYLVKVGS